MAIAEHLIPRIVHHQEPGITQTILTGVKERVLQIPMTRKQEPAEDTTFVQQPDAFGHFSKDKVVPRKDNKKPRPVTVVLFDPNDFFDPRVTSIKSL